MVVQMNEHVSHMKREYNNRMENEDKDRIAQMPTVVNNVIWGRHQESKASWCRVNINRKLAIQQ